MDGGSTLLGHSGSWRACPAIGATVACDVVCCRKTVDGLNRCRTEPNMCETSRQAGRLRLNVRDLRFSRLNPNDCPDHANRIPCQNRPAHRFFNQAVWQVVRRMCAVRSPLRAWKDILHARVLLPASHPIVLSSGPRHRTSDVRWPAASRQSGTASSRIGDLHVPVAAHNELWLYD
jgi:hypothetical protein